jgi:hypothetical protein
MKKQKSELEKQANIYLGVIPKIMVMQPAVVNENGPSESVASEGFDTEQGVVLQKIDSFDFDNQEDGK